MHKDKLYQTLSDGQWHSGQALADALGVSRTAVWKQLERLREQGFHIEASRGRGYRLGDANHQLYQRALLQLRLSHDGWCNSWLGDLDL